MALKPPNVPQNVVVTWGVKRVGDGDRALRGPVESIILGASFSQFHGNPGTPFAGMEDDSWAQYCIFEDFAKDLSAAVAGVAAKYNTAMGQFAENADLPCYVGLEKRGTTRGVANYHTHQEAMAALSLHLTGGTPVGDAVSRQVNDGAKYKLKRIDEEHASRRSSTLSVASKK